MTLPFPFSPDRLDPLGTAGHPAACRRAGCPGHLLPVKQSDTRWAVTCSEPCCPVAMVLVKTHGDWHIDSDTGTERGCGEVKLRKWRYGR